jgi:hypothetical protein
MDTFLTLDDVLLRPPSGALAALPSCWARGKLWSFGDDATRRLRVSVSIVETSIIKDVGPA